MGVLRKIKAFVSKRNGLALFPDAVIKKAEHAEIEIFPPNLNPPEPRVGGSLSGDAVYFPNGTAFDKAAIRERTPNPRKPIVSEKHRRAETFRDLVASKMGWEP